MKTDVILQLAEIFVSIQGESSHAGLACVFIRLAGCNLRCSFCDSRYTYEEPGNPYPLPYLLAFVDSHPHAIVELTGGEPLLQEGVYELMYELLLRDRTVLLETNGSMSLARVPPGIIKIMDLKCPGSGMSDRMDLRNLTLLNAKDEIKFVIADRLDFDWAIQMIKGHGLLNKQGNILFSPVAKTMPSRDLARWILDANLPVRLQIQLHKLLWPEIDRGI